MHRETDSRIDRTNLADGGVFSLDIDKVIAKDPGIELNTG